MLMNNPCPCRDTYGDWMSSTPLAGPEPLETKTQSHPALRHGGLHHSICERWKYILVVFSNYFRYARSVFVKCIPLRRTASHIRGQLIEKKKKKKCILRNHVLLSSESNGHPASFMISYPTTPHCMKNRMNIVNGKQNPVKFIPCHRHLESESSP